MFIAPRCLPYAAVAFIVVLASQSTAAQKPADPPAVNPFGNRATTRDDALPGYLELSDGTIRPGLLFLTRDARLKIYDEKVQRQRDVPLQSVVKIECSVLKEWMEKEWRFKEAANDEKVFTGKTYPAREYVHTITLPGGRTITGPLSAIVYVQADEKGEAERFLLHKRDKGPIDATLKGLLYVKRIEIGKEALEKARERQKQKEKAAPATPTKAKPTRTAQARR